jgi:hypothetical protein
MKRLSIGSCLLFLFLLFVPGVKAQSRYVVGVSGVGAFDNESAGVTVAGEFPFLKHYELDLKDTFSPIETHVALGGGRANVVSGTGFVWLTQKFGFVGAASDSMYDVTKVSKDGDYAFGGVAYRANVGGFPARFTFEYTQQFNNGIAPSGVESSHLKGADIGYTMVFGCFKSACVRTSEDLVFGHVLTQGNPQCDGTFGTTVTCARGSAVSGGVEGSIQLVFGKGRSKF